nr:hypothetical protein Iba_chr01dCG3160 [Ipomoea batatas]
MDPSSVSLSPLLNNIPPSYLPSLPLSRDRAATGRQQWTTPGEVPILFPPSSKIAMENRSFLHLYAHCSKAVAFVSNSKTEQLAAAVSNPGVLITGLHPSSRRGGCLVFRHCEPAEEEGGGLPSVRRKAWRDPL